MVSSSNFNSINSIAKITCIGSLTSISSPSKLAYKIMKSINNIKQIYSDIVENREILYQIIGLKDFVFSSNMSTTFTNDMGIIERQFNFTINKIQNKLIRIQLKDVLFNHYDKLVQLRNTFEKTIAFLRKNNSISKEISNYVNQIEKYFDINTSTHKDEDEFDNLEIPSELEF